MDTEHKPGDGAIFYCDELRVALQTGDTTEATHALGHLGAEVRELLVRVAELTRERDAAYEKGRADAAQASFSAGRVAERADVVAWLNANNATVARADRHDFDIVRGVSASEHIQRGEHIRGAVGGG